MPTIPRAELQRKKQMYINARDLSLTTSEVYAHKIFLEDYIKLDEGVLEFLPRLGFRKKFSNKEDLQKYIESKFSGALIDVTEYVYEEGSMLKKDYIVKIAGEEIARLQSI